jgi:hypothetical protein
VRENDVSTSPSVANVASVARHIPKTENPAPVAIAPVAELRRAETSARLDAMAAENERRRDWQAKPVDGWREGRLVMRSALTGEEITINLPKETRH